jgi:hypothetical protein
VEGQGWTTDRADSWTVQGNDLAHWTVEVQPGRARCAVARGAPGPARAVSQVTFTFKVEALARRMIGVP